MGKVALIVLCCAVVAAQIIATLGEGRLTYRGVTYTYANDKGAFLARTVVLYGAELLAMLLALYVVFFYQP